MTRSADRPWLRRCIFRLLAATVVPMVLLAGLELVLRVAGVGEPTRLLVPVEGQDALTTNPNYGWRFFPRNLARRPEVLRMARHKAPGTCRIFVLGGSAAQGIPNPAYSFGRVLEVMLEQVYPQQRFEMHNLAMVAINSHVVREIARESAAFEPDVVLVYMGNNEVVGPYGPGTVFQRFAASSRQARASLWIASTRIGQLLRRLIPAPAGPRTWKGMETFAGREVRADDARLEVVYQNLRSNLAAIIRSEAAAGAEVLVSTVATDLVHTPPFASAHRQGLSAAQLEQWTDLVGRGDLLVGEARTAEAVELFSNALGIDDQYAELHYQLGSALLNLGRAEQARAHLQRARDLDTLRFCADSRINEIIREATGATLVDGAAALDAAPEAVHALAGDALLHEHVHLSFAGNYRLAESFFARLRPLLDARFGSSALELPTQERCAELIAFSHWSRERNLVRIAVLAGRAPFTNQLGHQARLQQRRQRVAEARLSWISEPESTINVHRAAVNRKPDDLYLRQELARLFEGLGRIDEAGEQWQQLNDRLPRVVDWQRRAAAALLAQGRVPEAVAALEDLARARPKDEEVQTALAVAIAQSGDLDLAEEHFDRAVVLNPLFIGAWLERAVVLEDRQLGERAARAYGEALAINPEAAEAHLGLGGLREKQGRIDDAMAAYRRAAELAPALSDARINLAVLLLDSGQAEEALAELELVAEVDPAAARAHFALGDAYLAVNRPLQAVEAYRLGLGLSPDTQPARHNLALALFRLGRHPEAAAQYRTLLQQAPQSPPALQGLAWLLATTDDAQLRDPAEAARLAEQANRLSGWQVPEFLETLAVAYAAEGRHDEARDVLERALAAARARGAVQAAERISRRLLDHP